MSARRRILWVGLIACWCAPGTAMFAADRESFTEQFFEQLRQRGLYQLAERHADARLADAQLSENQRTNLAIELARTLAAHAAVTGDDQQAELWQRANEVLNERFAVAEDLSQRLRLEFALIDVFLVRAESLVFDSETSPFDEPAREALKKTVENALQRLSDVDESLSAHQRSQKGKKKPAENGPGPDIRALTLRKLWQTGLALQTRARLAPGGSQERLADLQSADERFRKVVNSGRPDEQFDAKLALAVSNRLRDELDRGFEMLESLEQTAKAFDIPRADAVRLERARLLLASRRPDAAAKELLPMHAGRDRLSGEFWLTEFQVLTALRRIAAERKNQPLIEDLQAQVQTSLEDVDRQAGGVWSRRCRQVWSQAEESERYGHRLSALVAQARAEYVAGRTAAAIAAYSSACDLAEETGQGDLAMDIGETLSGILAEDQRWDELVRRVQSLKIAAPDHAKLPRLHLLAIYGLGKLLDLEPTAERRAAYAAALDEHREKFAASPTVSDVEYLRGRLAETEQRYAEATEAYHHVPGDHEYGASAAAAWARSRVLQLLDEHETGKPTTARNQELLDRLTAKLQALPEQPTLWDDAQTELVYHASKVLLLLKPPRLADAGRWLDRLEQATSADEDEEPLSDQRRELRRRIAPLRLVLLAARGKPQQPAQILSTLSEADALELLAVVEELNQLEQGDSETARRNLIETQLAAAEMLDRRRSELTLAQLQRLDLALADSYFATSQPSKAISAYQRMLDRAPRDGDLARRLAGSLQARKEPESRQLSIVCWQRAEGLLKQGSHDWLEVRRQLIESCLQAGETERARKLLSVTKLLYPQLGGQELSRRYAELEARLK